MKGKAVKCASFLKRTLSMLMVFAVMITAIPIADTVVYAAETQGTENTAGEEEISPASETGGKKTVKLFVENGYNWSGLYAHIWGNNGTDDTQMEGATSWPGNQLKDADGDGWYELEHTYTPNENENFMYILNNGSSGDGNQTSNLSIPYDVIKDGFEGWVHYNSTDSSWCAAPIESTPVVNGNEVTFYYYSTTASNVYLIGSMNEWSKTATPMTKDENNIFSCTLTLDAGDYEYKFFVDSNWINDPLNELKSGDNNKITVPETTTNPEPEFSSPVINGNQATFNYFNSSASAVYLAGEMNGWTNGWKDGTEVTDTENVIKMTSASGNGLFSVTLDNLERGKSYQYKYVYIADNKDNWITDPKNSLTYTEESGNVNSIIYIPGLVDTTLTDAVPKGTPTNLPTEIESLNADGTKGTTSVTWSVADEYKDYATISAADDTGVQTITVTKDCVKTSIVLVAASTEEATTEADTANVTVNLEETTYTYTIYAYSTDASHMSADNAALWIWDKAAGAAGSEYAFTTTETLSDGNKWLKVEVPLNYGEELGVILKSKGKWASDEGGWQSGDLSYANTTGAVTNTFYIADIGGSVGVYTNIDDVPKTETNYVIVEYTKSAFDGSFEDTNVYTWNTGFGEVTYNFTEINGKYIAKIPVIASENDKTMGFIVRKGTDWSTAVKDGGDNYVTIPAGQHIVKLRFADGKITEILPENVGNEIDRKNGKLYFYYRDDALFEASNLSSLAGNVKLAVRTVSGNSEATAEAAYTMTYDEAADRFVYEMDLIDDTDYYYYYLINDSTKVLDAYNKKTGTLEDVEYSLRRNKQYAINLKAELTYASMTYEDNNVLKVSWTAKNEGDDLEGFKVEKAYANLSSLGLSSVAIDPELMEVSFGCLEGTEAGTKTIPIVLTDDCDVTYTTYVEVTIAERTKTANTDTKLGDFDWDEAVIYFAVTDRFFDGNTENNAKTGGYDATDTTDQSRYHGGDFAGLTQKIDYLYDLGVNTIWLTPIVDNIDQNVRDAEDDTDGIESYGYHGYWTSDFTALNPHLGTEAEFKALIEAAHAKGMKVMVDVVLNHAGYGTEDYFNRIITVNTTTDDKGNEVKLYKNMVRDESNTVAGDMQLDGLSGLPDFVTEDADVRAKLIEWQTTWMKEYDIDYYRVDTVKHVENTTWSAFKNELTKINQDFKLIGEYYDAGFYNDYGQLDSGKMDSVLDFHFNDVISNIAAENLSAIEDALAQRNAALTNTATFGSFLSSHDENGFLYDLINKHGESTDWANALMKVAATYQITAKGQPVIYYGEEIGQTGANNYPYQDNRYDFDWDELTAQKSDTNSMYHHYKKMLNIRRDYSEVFAKGDRNVVVEPLTYSDANGTKKEQGYEVFSRSYEGTKLYIGINVWGDAKDVTLYVAGADGDTYTDLYNNTKYTVTNGMITISIPGAANGGTAVLVKDEKGTEPEDTNSITLKLHYNREDGNYDYGTPDDTSDDWNVWIWGFGSARYDFVEENGEMVATIELKDAGRSVSSMWYRIRRGDWKENDHNAKDQSIDLSDVVSGTVHYYVESGVWGGVRVLGADAVVGCKITSAEYNRSTNRIVAETSIPIQGSYEKAFAVTCTTDEKTVAISGVEENGCTYTITLDDNLSSIEALLKSYSLAFDGYDYTLTMPNIYGSAEFESAYTYDGDDLGVAYTKESATFKVWAPTADSVTVNIYESGTKGTEDLVNSYTMTGGTKNDKGVWSYTASGDWSGYYYTYTVSVNNEINEVCDPYARTTGVNGNRAMILDLDSTDPEGWEEDTGAHTDMEYTDAIIYELHVRDLSIDDSSGVSEANQGKFLGLTETGTTTEDGRPTALDHMIDLGVTHLHLLPIYDYASVDETKLDKAQFNWGYDPLNYNVPEGSYSTNPYDGSVRVNEMKQMIMALHENNINVVMDVVYNHVYDAESFCFNRIVPKYFSRTNKDGSYSNGSGCGNDTATERSMVHKYVVDSILYWHDEYHIDGFRFDLVGLLDTETINTIVEEVHAIDPDIIFYGEGWTLGTSLSEGKENYIMATQQNAWATPEFAYFSDTLRNGVAGTDTNGIGFIWGSDNESTIAECFLGSPWWCPEPLQTINYASCHDNYTLMDKINVVSGVEYKDYTYTPGEKQVKLNNLAAAVYMLSEGIPLIHAGEDFLRVKLDETGEVIHNSYNASDYVNQIRWYNLDEEIYADTSDYYEGLIEFRKNHEALRLATSEEADANVAYHWVTNDVVLFKVNGKDNVPGEVSDGIIVIFNASDSELSINLYGNDGSGNAYNIAQGTWNICINAEDAGTDILGTVENGWATVDAKSALVLVKGETVDTDTVYTQNNKVTVSLDRTKAYVAEKETLTLKGSVNVTPADSTLLWASSDESIATVADGVVTGVGKGTAEITVSTLHGVTASCTVIVGEKRITLSPTDISVTIGETGTLTATVEEGETIASWESSDTSVAAVTADADDNSKAVITAVAKGTAIITVTTESGCSAECIVTVLEEPIVFLHESHSLRVDESVKLTAVVRSDREIAAWTSGDEAIATVDEEGTVTALSEGSTTITVTTNKGETAICEITVTQRAVALNASKLSIIEERSSELTAILAEGEEIQGWSTSDASIATVTAGENNTATIQALKVGTATITVTTSDGATAACQVTVTQKPVILNKEEITLLLNDETANTAVLTAVLAEGETIANWTSNHELVATVTASENNTASITAVGAGIANIEVITASGERATCVVTVTDDVVALEQTTLTLTEEEEAQLTAVVGGSLYVTGWTSSDETVASVTANEDDSSNATVTALKAGTAEITITVSTRTPILPRTVDTETYTASCTVTVTEKEKVTLDKTSLTMIEKGTDKLTATVNSGADVIWSSENTGVVTVDKDGNVTAVGVGTTTITATTANGTAESCTVTVKAVPIALTETAINITEGDTYTITPAVLDETAEIIWKSANTEIATVSDGKVTGVSVGSTTITATVDGYSVSCAVTVIEGTSGIEPDPETPDEPSEPSEPETPDEPSEPSEPETPDEPSEPSEPETPDEPSEPSEPDVPEDVKEVTYVPKDEPKKAVDKELSILIEKIKDGKDLENAVTEETLKKVKEALDAGKELITELIVDNVVISHVEQKVQEMVEKAIEALLGNAEDVEIAQYMDISILIKEVGGDICGTLDELTEEITITLAIPEKWKAEGRTFYMVRIHDGKADILPATENKDGTVSFKTSQFSAYTLIYKDMEPDSEQGGTQAPETETPKSPPTGYVEEQKPQTNMFGIVMFAVLFAAAYFCYKKQGKIHKR
uniref:type I pullulanase n=1 Tax=Agathobacter sp. TaxID=2021311 RepID=UPI004055EA22